MRFILLAWLAVLTACSAAPALRPNIVFLLADDLRRDALGCWGNAIVQTPNLDRLAARGVRFDNHFVTTSICNVSRASILGGQYLRRHGIVDFATPFTRAQWRETYPALLRQAGYRTGFIGKFGVGSNAAVKAMSEKFDFWRGLPDQGGLFFDPDDPTRTHKTARFGGQALEFIRGGDATRPFCLSVSFTAPHARDQQPREFAPDPRDESLYAGVTIPRPPKSGGEWFQNLPLFVQTSEGRPRWERRFATDEMFQKTTRDYYRLVTGLDREAGRILTSLHALGLAGNTVVIVTSDNGFFLGERGLADKWLMYEESLRVPLIICDPSRPVPRRGRSVEAMTLNVDLAPTLLEFAGLRPPGRMQGRSLVPLLNGRSPRGWRTEFFYEHHTLPKIIPPSEGVRTERWKYLRWVTAAPVVEELYDLSADPGEERNLVADSRHSRQLETLRKRWEKMRTDLK